jgi:hypothetical protein
MRLHCFSGEPLGVNYRSLFNELKHQSTVCRNTTQATEITGESACVIRSCTAPRPRPKEILSSQFQ